MSLEGAPKFHSQIVSFRYQYQYEALLHFQTVSFRYEYECPLLRPLFSMVARAKISSEGLTPSPLVAPFPSKRTWHSRDLSAWEIGRQGMSKSSSLAILAHVHRTCRTCCTGRWGRGRG